MTFMLTLKVGTGGKVTDKNGGGSITGWRRKQE